MSKDAFKDKDPLAYRVLLMMPAVCRLWGRLRLQHLAPLIKAWELPEMYAGTGGKGAADAAYATAMDFELFDLEGIDFTGASADIYKFFDQIKQFVHSIDNFSARTARSGCRDRRSRSFFFCRIKPYKTNMVLHNCLLI